jgi:hypothetical protein
MIRFARIRRKMGSQAIRQKKPIGLSSASMWLCLSLCSCSEKVANQPSFNPNSGLVDSTGGTQDSLIPTTSIDTPVAVRVRKDPSKVLPTRPQVTTQNRILPQKDPRKFTRMTERIADSLRATPGAVLRLHPEDYVIFREHTLARKLLSPQKNPQTGEYLSFPYAYPLRYGADIRRLDSIKTAQTIKSIPAASPDTLGHRPATK